MTAIRAARRLAGAVLLAALLAVASSPPRSRSWSRRAESCATARRSGPRQPTSTDRSSTAAASTPAYAARPAERAGGPTIRPPTTTSRCGSLELTYTHVKLDDERQPNIVVVRLTRSAALPLPDALHGRHRHAALHEPEVANLRDYLLKGGFLWVDDFWGSAAWEHWAREIGRVLPPAEFPIFDIPPTTRSCTRCTT